MQTNLTKSPGQVTWFKFFSKHFKWIAPYPRLECNIYQEIYKQTNSSGTGCRTYNPGRWSYGWTSQLGATRWNNFDDAWAACQSIGNDCGTLYHNLDDWQIKRGTGLSAEHPLATMGQHSGAWTAISDTRSTYCWNSAAWSQWKNRWSENHWLKVLSM